ncbi:hypothetical protein IE53DRAFT_379183 [Violaceomyces palustris]|uniref:Uncharacterized protein n=1 Tax=Violaceomyces palustris TaxID=1673888 RepID=A0ACD0NZ84_9BASI|nr:hypothetical protein IE53DRAFT_379183 [Violaceomyces palustris]
MAGFSNLPLEIHLLSLSQTSKESHRIYRTYLSRHLKLHGTLELLNFLHQNLPRVRKDERNKGSQRKSRRSKRGCSRKDACEGRVEDEEEEEKEEEEEEEEVEERRMRDSKSLCLNVRHLELWEVGVPPQFLQPEYDLRTLEERFKTLPTCKISEEVGGPIGGLTSLLPNLVSLKVYQTPLALTPNLARSLIKANPRIRELTFHSPHVDASSLASLVRGLEQLHTLDVSGVRTCWCRGNLGQTVGVEDLARGLISSKSLRRLVFTASRVVSTDSSGLLELLSRPWIEKAVMNSGGGSQHHHHHHARGAPASPHSDLSSTVQSAQGRQINHLRLSSLELRRCDIKGPSLHKLLTSQTCEGLVQLFLGGCKKLRWRHLVVNGDSFRSSAYRSVDQEAKEEVETEDDLLRSGMGGDPSGSMGWGEGKKGKSGKRSWGEEVEDLELDSRLLSERLFDHDRNGLGNVRRLRIYRAEESDVRLLLSLLGRGDDVLPRLREIVILPPKDEIGRWIRGLERTVTFCPFPTTNITSTPAATIKLKKLLDPACPSVNATPKVNESGEVRGGGKPSADDPLRFRTVRQTKGAVTSSKNLRLTVIDDERDLEEQDEEGSGGSEQGEDQSNSFNLDTNLEDKEGGDASDQPQDPPSDSDGCEEEGEEEEEEGEEGDDLFQEAPETLSERLSKGLERLARRGGRGKIHVKVGDRLYWRVRRNEMRMRFWAETERLWEEQEQEQEQRLR